MRDRAEKRLWLLIDEKIKENAGNKKVVKVLNELKEDMKDIVLDFKTED